MTKDEAAIAEPAADAEPVADAQPTNPTEGAASDASKPTDAAEGGDAAAAKADGDASDAEEAGEVTINPVKLGPVTFNSGDEMMLWFSHLRAENTLNQNLNDYEAAVVEACIRQGHDNPDSKL